MWNFDKDHRERLLPMLRDYENRLEMLNKGFYFAMGRDNSHRPIIYFKSKTWIKSGISIDEMLNTVDTVLSYVIYNELVPGRIENYHNIIDLKDVSWSEMPFSSFNKFAKHTRNGYFSRSASLCFVNAPKVVQVASMFIFKLVDDFQAAKMFLFSDDFGPKLKKIIGKENLEKPYGGYIPEKKADFWPPSLNARAEKPAKKNDKK